MRAASQSWALSLCKVARVRAKKLEATTAIARRKEWKAAIGANGSDGRQRTTPSRLAYRWARGVGGWQASPIGDDALHHGIPDVDDIDDDGRILDQDEFITPSTRAEQEELVPLADQAAVDMQANDWAELWQEDVEYEHPLFDGNIESLGPLLPWALQQAAMTFPAGTGLGADYISPRAIARLSLQALLALAALLVAFEQRGFEQYS